MLIMESNRPPTPRKKGKRQAKKTVLRSDFLGMGIEKKAVKILYTLYM
jgi:hypothetical protein